VIVSASQSGELFSVVPNSAGSRTSATTVKRSSTTFQGESLERDGRKASA